MIHFHLNGEAIALDLPADTPLLWAVRDHLKLKGSKFGCGKGLCGACTMHMDGQAIRTCILPIAVINGKHITTIEGLGTQAQRHPLQESWVKHNVPQCGYCQSGQLMSASALLANNPTPTDEDIDIAMSGNICRCGTYPRIKAAIKDAAATMAANKGVEYYTPEDSDKSLMMSNSLDSNTGGRL